jgi:hypothetical protein
MNAASFRRMAMALPDTSDAAHFDRTAFRTPQRIFATMPADGRSANLKLPAATQLRVVRDHPDAFEAITGGWGRQGWTTVTLASIDKAVLLPILLEAHALAAVKVTKRKVPRR